MTAWAILLLRSLASWIDSYGDDRHLTTDPACVQHRPPRQGSQLDRASRSVPCVPCMRHAAFGDGGCFVFDYAAVKHDADCCYPERPCVCSVVFPSLLRRDGSTM